MPALLVHAEVQGAEIASVEVRRGAGTWEPAAWADLSSTHREPGRYEVRAHVSTTAPGEAVRVPVCAGRSSWKVDGKGAASGAGPVIRRLDEGPHEVVLTIDVSAYERRIACGEPLRVGPIEDTTEGLGTLAFDSPYGARGGGQAVLYVPRGRSLASGGPLLVGLHPWNGTRWTYAAYQELLRSAQERGVVLLMPSGLGNSLYTADAEDEVLRAIAALEAVAGAASWNVTLWGASMGGAGATTIGFHHPDHFAAVVSFFGDSKYDLSTYVRAILPDEQAAHRVNALDVVDNARNLPVRLIHGEEDRTSPLRQSEMLAEAMKQRGFAVRFDRVPGMGHSGALVARFLPEIVEEAAVAHTNTRPARITYRSVRPTDTSVYDLRLRRDSMRDAFVDVARQATGAIAILHHEGLSAISVVDAPDGSTRTYPIDVDEP